jgi:hydrogenase maturation protease
VPRTLIAGFGNVLRGDDGFGVEVVRRLEQAGTFGQEVRFMEVGTGGIRLAQELLAGYDRLIVVDAMLRGSPPGTVYVRQVEAVEAATDVDLHLAVPARALSVAQALGALPRVVFLVGCEPVQTEELTTELSPPVRAGVEEAIRRIHALMSAAPPRHEAIPT